MADGAAALGAAVYAPQFFRDSDILASVAATLGNTVAGIKSKRVLPGLVAARQVCALLFAEFTLLSQVEMGAALGRGDHTAGRHTLVRARLRLEQDKVFRAAFEQARKRLLEVNHA